MISINSPTRSDRRGIITIAEHLLSSKSQDSLKEMEVFQRVMDSKMYKSSDESDMERKASNFLTFSLSLISIFMCFGLKMFLKVLPKYMLLYVPFVMLHSCLVNLKKGEHCTVVRVFTYIPYIYIGIVISLYAALLLAVIWYFGRFLYKIFKIMLKFAIFIKKLCLLWF